MSRRNSTLDEVRAGFVSDTPTVLVSVGAFLTKRDNGQYHATPKYKSLWNWDQRDTGLVAGVLGNLAKARQSSDIYASLDANRDDVSTLGTHEGCKWHLISEDTMTAMTEACQLNSAIFAVRKFEASTSGGPGRIVTDASSGPSTS